jgi:3-oxoacyl-[acyl-carrier-protein] synthase-3
MLDAAPALRRPSAELTRSRTAAILSVATELPSGRLTNAELSDRLGVTEEWIVARTGIRERRRAAASERLADYAARAGASALDAAGVDAMELDLVIVGTMTPDELTPNAAPLVAEALGARRAGAFDVGAACTGWLAGIATASGQIESGRARSALVVGADFLSRYLDLSDRDTAPLFADGAGAAVLGPASGSSGRIGPVVLHSDQAGAELIRLDRGGRIAMRGPDTFREAVRALSDVSEEALAASGHALSDIDLFVYHQANSRILRAVGERLGIASERVLDCIAEYANTSAATLPLALAHAQASGMLRNGDRVLLGAFGAGFTWGGAVIQWGIGA